MLGAGLNHITTLEELQASDVKITKKIILVNSSKYTDEAFEYLLDLIDDSEAIAFVINERKIYTHGEYFGGDLWEDTLDYFSKYMLIDENNNITSQIYAQTPKDAIQFKGEGGIVLYSDYDINREVNTIHFQYDLNAAIDHTTVFKINDELFISLDVENGKISLKKYVPVKFIYDYPQIVEYDSGDKQLSLPIRIENSEKLNEFHITGSNDVIPVYDPLLQTINATIPNNTEVTIYIDYSDKNGFEYVEPITQQWGYKYAFGSGASAIRYDNINNFLTEIENRFSEKTININIPDGQYGWLAYPSTVQLSFTDLDSGLIGGWKKHSKFRLYTSNIEYQVYRTENVGLGNTKWKLTQKQ